MSNLKLGIFGTGRAKFLVPDFLLNGFDIVAVCDMNNERMKMVTDQLDDSVACYTDFDKFIEHDMDAVFLGNFFHEHAPYAIKCFERGIHVLSECISNGTMAEGVELLRAFEKSDSIYMLAENYPQRRSCLEMKRVCEGGTLGKILYAEGEYNHPGKGTDASFAKMYNYFPEHWRNFLPRSYYVTHSLGPIMAATGATPKRVTSFNIFDEPSKDLPTYNYAADRAAIIMTQNDDGSVFRFTGCASFGAHHNYYRVCGTKGQIENIWGMDDKILLRYNDWEVPEGMQEVNFYEPEWDKEANQERLRVSGHGGGDLLTVRIFADCIRAKKQPPHPFDVYSAVNMSSVAILSHRSMLDGGIPYDIPDFKNEEARKQYENDRHTPFYGTDGTKPDIPCCSKTDYAPSKEQMDMKTKLLENAVIDAKSERKHNV